MPSSKVIDKVNARVWSNSLSKEELRLEGKPCCDCFHKKRSVRGFCWLWSCQIMFYSLVANLSSIFILKYFARGKFLCLTDHFKKENKNHPSTQIGFFFNIDIPHGWPQLISPVLYFGIFGLFPVPHYYRQCCDEQACGSIFVPTIDYFNRTDSWWNC